jgi:hypothetical protein
MPPAEPYLRAWDQFSVDEWDNFTPDHWDNFLPHRDVFSITVLMGGLFVSGDEGIHGPHVKVS